MNLCFDKVAHLSQRGNGSQGMNSERKWRNCDCRVKRGNEGCGLSATADKHVYSVYTDYSMLFRLQDRQASWSCIPSQQLLLRTMHVCACVWPYCVLAVSTGAEAAGHTWRDVGDAFV